MNWLRCTFCCLLAFSYVWVAFGQNADPRFNTAGSDRSIRRIFVPEAKLDSVLRSNLRPLEANRLDSYLQSLNAGSGEPSGEGDKETLLVGRSHLQSFHAIARLVGPDLYSDRTRLRMTDESVKQLSSRSTEKISIFPWNLAMEGDSNTEPLGGQQNKGSGIGRGGGTDTVGSSNSAAVLMTQSPKWLFDESGTPLVDSGSTEHWIDWSLRPSLESNAKELFFEIAIPRTIDGCLILELPNGAKVQSSNGVSRKFENWDSIWERLVDWPDRKEPLTPQRSDAFEVSLWGIELSGETKVRFKIELGNSQLRGKLGELPSDWGVEQLVSKQTLQYTPHEDDLRIASEWELVGARDSGRTLRIEVPAGVKVRSFQWNEKPISVTMNEGTIEIPFAAPLTGEVSNKVKLIGEFYLPWSALAKYSTSTEKRFRLPVIQLADSYVISGTTIFQDTNSNRFVGVRSDRGRVETARKSQIGRAHV